MGEVHPLWRPYEPPTPEEIRRVQVGGRTPVPGGRVEVAAPDPTWPARYDEVARQVREALGERVLGLQHVGSTSVAGLDAKPVIDVDLTVADSADEASYLPDLETAGFTLRVREPDWEEHRCLRGDGPGLQPPRVLAGRGRAAAATAPSATGCASTTTTGRRMPRSSATSRRDASTR